jgi:hypothetical protein
MNGVAPQFAPSPGPWQSNVGRNVPSGWSRSGQSTPTWQATEWPADQGPVTEEAPAGPHLYVGAIHPHEARSITFKPSRPRISGMNGVAPQFAPSPGPWQSNVGRNVSSERTPTWQATEWPADQGPVTEEAPAGPHLYVG